MKVLIVNAFSEKRSTSVGGGHYRSMLQTAISLSENNHKVTVLDIGDPLPLFFIDKIKFHNIEYIHCKVPFFTPWKIFGFMQSVDFYDYDCVSFFDFKPYSFLRLLVPRSRRSSPVWLLTRCGGKNPNNMYPDAPNIVCFSIENEAWFKNKKKNSNIYLMPNRVSRPDQELGLVNSIKANFGINGKVLLRICRIDGQYDWTVLQGAKLANKLKELHGDVTYLVIGRAISNDHKKELQEKVSAIYKNTVLITDDAYTSEAAKCIDVADYVIGTGRGFMEAISLGKVSFSPNKTSELPLFVDKTSFESAFAFNFSGRSCCDDNYVDSSFKRFQEIAQSEAGRISYGVWAQEIFKRYFDASEIPGFYEKIARNSSNSDGFMALLRNLWNFVHFFLYLNVKKK